MYIIGLTGGIASGKTTVAGMLRDLGAAVVDADEVSRALTAPGGEALPAIREAFGDAVFEGALLHRRALADRIFASEQERQQLNGLMFPRILAGVRRRLAVLAQAGTAVAVVDMPLLFEMGFEASADAIWVCQLPRAEQLARLMRRNDLTRGEAQARIEGQLPAEALCAAADVRIDTGRFPETVRAQVVWHWQQIQQKESRAKGKSGAGNNEQRYEA